MPMAEAVVSSVGQTIGKLLINEAKFLWGVEGKVKDLEKELKLIQRFLRDADVKQEHDRAVEEFVAQLRDIAYDAEDVIEQYILRVAPKKGQNITKAYACFMARCACVEAHVVGIKIDGLRSSISNLRTSMRDYGIQSLNEGEHKHARASMLKRSYDHFEEDFVGREDSIEELVKELLNDKKQRVIFIWGMGGLGKTSLAKKIIAHDKVKNSFNGIAWACVSQEYQSEDILMGILVELIPDQRKRVKKMRKGELLKTLYKIQQEKRCIVVLDDIWTKEAWVSLQAAFPIKNMRSKLLITTRNKEVAKHIDHQGFFHELRYLSYEESWDILKKRAFPETKGLAIEIGQGTTAGQAIEDYARQLETDVHLPKITEDMKKLAYELLKKCAGLPLAVIVLGGLLAVNEWKTLHEKINLHFSDKTEVAEMLALSYDDLPWHLKPCFLYLGSFLDDAKIPATKVLHMWIAEGLVSLDKYHEQRGIQVEDVAEQYLKELFNRGMVQVQFKLSGKIKSCYLHEMMQELCISKALRESFLSILNIQRDNGIENCSASVGMKVESSCKIRRLSLKGNVIPSLEPLGHLRTLMLFESVNWKSKQFQPIFSHCKFLKVLILENLDLMGNLPKSLGDLVHLRFLSLVDSQFEVLPQSMGNLVCLEFLDLFSNICVVVTMPNVLWKMRRLAYLRLPYNFAIREKIHKDQKKLQLDTLKNLRTLRNFSPNKCDVNDVGKLTNLQKLTVYWRDLIELEIFPQLAKFTLKNLRSSSFCFSISNGSWTEGELSKMSNYCHYCKLSIGGTIEKLPEYKNLPQQLRKLVLLKSVLKEDPMPILEKLDHLVVLKLVLAFVGEKMVCSSGGFPELKHLVLYKLDELEEWRVGEGAMPRLSLLGISKCPNLKKVPEEVSHAHEYDSTDEILNELSKNNSEGLIRTTLPDLGAFSPAERTRIVWIE